MEKEQGKKDYKFLSILAGLLILCVVLSIYLQDLNKTTMPESQPLPEESDETIYTKLMISEVLSNNGGSYINENGFCCDYVEIYNGENVTVNLFNYGLSDTVDRIKWAFPDIDIRPGQYMVINLTGQEQDGLNAGFKLSSKGGEELILINNKGSVIDAVKTVALGKNQCMIRNGREWNITSTPTPGFENSEKGLEAYRKDLKSAGDSPLVLNELLCKNDGNYINIYGRTDGYIELINVSDQYITLSDCYISDDPVVPFKFQLPKEYLAPGELFLLYSEDNSYVPDKYTGFGFQNKTGSVFISMNGKIISQTDYENVPNGCAYIRNEAGDYYASAAISPGHPNTIDGVDAFQKTAMSMPKGLVINEVMSSNSTVIPQNGYQFYDWIELYNNSGQPIDLGEYCLTTTAGDP